MTTQIILNRRKKDGGDITLASYGFLIPLNCDANSNSNVICNGVTYRVLGSDWNCDTRTFIIYVSK